MASIEKRNAGNKTTYRVKVRLKGYPTQTATFDRLTDAKKWTTATESAISNQRRTPLQDRRIQKTHLDWFSRALHQRHPTHQIENPRKHPKETAWAMEWRNRQLLRNVHGITSSTDLSWCPSSVLPQQLHSSLCACCSALKTNNNPAPVDEFIPCTFLRICSRSRSMDTAQGNSERKSTAYWGMWAFWVHF